MTCHDGKYVCGVCVCVFQASLGHGGPTKRSLHVSGFGKGTTCDVIRALFEEEVRISPLFLCAILRT